MSSQKRDWKHVVFGWAIDFDGDPKGDPEPATEEQLNTLPAIDSDRVAAPKNGVVDTAEIFRLAEIPDDEVDSVGRALGLLRNLPGEATIDVKRQIVGASLKAFGFDPDRLIQAGVKEIKALEAYIRAGAAQATKRNAAAQERIQTLQTEIAQLSAEIQRNNADQEQRTKACTEKKLEVQQVLEFFGPDEVRRAVGAQSSPQS